MPRIPEVAIPADLDDLDLTPQEFRVYCHYVRRGGRNRTAWPKVESVAKHCRVKKDTVISAIKTLESLGLLVRLPKKPREPSRFEVVTRIPRKGNAKGSAGIPPEGVSHSPNPLAGVPRNGSAHVLIEEGEQYEGEKEKESPIPPEGATDEDHPLSRTETMNRLGAIFRRPEHQRWTDEELLLLAQVTPVDHDDLSDLEWFYTHADNKTSLRRSLRSLLRHLPSAMDEARITRARGYGKSVAGIPDIEKQTSFDDWSS